MSTILNKLEYLDETKTQIKNALNTKFNSGITDANTFRSYVSKIQNIYTNWAKLTDKGNNFTLTPTKKGKMQFGGLYGNTYQNSTKGINIFNINNGGSTSSEVSIDNDDYVSCTYDNTNGSNVHYSNFMKNKTPQIQPSTNYLIVVEILSVQGTGRLQPYTKHTSSCINNANTSLYFNNLTAGQKIFMPVTTKSEFDANTIYDLRALIIFDAGQSGSITFRLSLLTDTTITSDTFEYEPYTGGQPSPNPDYPQNIEVVTGEQTITITNGTSTNTYNLSLGSTELCKIGDYQDYIYKDNGKWYKHSEINKIVLDGSEFWHQGSTSIPNVFYIDSITDYATSNNIPFSQYFTGVSNVSGLNDMNDQVNNTIAFINNNTNFRFYVKATSFVFSDFKTWLSTHNLTLYYLLATPTTTEITDTTLINQLNALYNAHSKDNQTNISSNGIIISISALMKGGN